MSLAAVSFVSAALAEGANQYWPLVTFGLGGAVLAALAALPEDYVPVDPATYCGVMDVPVGLGVGVHVLPCGTAWVVGDSGMFGFGFAFRRA